MPFARQSDSTVFASFIPKKFKRKNGDFKGWTNEQCLALIADLAAITISRREFIDSVAMVVDNETYCSEYVAEHRPRKAQLDSQYGHCFRWCLAHCLVVIHKRFDHRKTLPTLNIVLDDGHQNTGYAIRIFQALREDLTGSDLEALDTITLAKKDTADL